jgi:hypothetical protein
MEADPVAVAAALQAAGLRDLDATPRRRAEYSSRAA